jgi:hypothetical protein
MASALQAALPFQSEPIVTCGREPPNSSFQSIRGTVVSAGALLEHW